MNSLRRNVDIAIIGLSCRFPGAATAAEYWKNLCDGVESITFFSDQELLAAGVDPVLVANPNYVKAAPMLPNVDMFDAEFFGYSPKDAALMDPQQRLFLEVCWEAFENAGYEPVGYPGKVGVLSTAGGVVSSYLLAKLHHASLPGQTASTSHIANDKDFLSTRVSFKLNLTGPSFTIQSACSSSLLAVHQACQTLRFGECDMMLVGGSVVRVPQIETRWDKGPFLAAASVQYCSSHWSRPSLIATTYSRSSRAPRRTTMARARAATPRRVWTSSRGRCSMRWIWRE